MLQKLAIILLIFLAAGLGFSQQKNGRGPGEGGTISGEVYDANSNAPIEYANIVLFSSNDSSQVNGTISAADGKFELNQIRPGSYYVEVGFIGFDKKRIEDLSVTPQNRNISLGKIVISANTINLDDVVVEGQRSPISYQIDKKVIDVSQMPTTISGNAADVLENVPSVTVDIEGNVSLRGSGNFKVLIDGRPSVLDAQDALQQIPASSIQNIEIITNPSAKYDPEGTAGIINIILKKNRNFGLSGIISANAGLNNKYGGDFLFEYKTPALNYNFGIDYNNRINPGTSIEERVFNLNGNTTFINSHGDREWGRTSFGLRGGVEFNLSEMDFLGIGARYGTRDSRSNSSSLFSQWSQMNPSINQYINSSNRSRTGDYLALHANYQKKFNNEGHQLLTEFFFSKDNSDEETISSELQSGIQFDGKRTTEFGPSSEVEGKINYTLPFSEVSKFEAGIEGQMEISSETNELFDYDSLSNSLQFQDQFSNSTDYNRSEMSLYSLYANEIGKFGFQGGIRSEYTFRTIELIKTNEKFEIDRWDFFPTFHSSYKITDVTQMMASYARRIDRPRGWYLEPFLTWMDANNVRRGNPALLPEYIDSYEFGFQTYFGKISLSTELYYRMTHNKIERVQSVYAENITLNTLENVGQDYSLGSEMMLLFDPVSFWNVNLMGNLYNYKVEGQLLGRDFSQESLTWNASASNSFKISANTQLQLNLRYSSPSVSSQGSREGFLRTDAAFKQDFFSKKLSLTLQVRDLFGTAKYESRSQGIDFSTYNYFTRESPMVMLNLRFNFNNFKEERKPGEDGGGFEGGGQEEF